VIHDDTIIRATAIRRRFRAHVYDCGRRTELTDRRSEACTRLTFTHATRNGFSLPPSSITHDVETLTLTTQPTHELIIIIINKTETSSMHWHYKYYNIYFILNGNI